MAEKIFINYRRGVDQGAVGRLYDQLERVFGRDGIFIDVDGILAGKDFAEEISERMAECDILLAAIGRGWADVVDENGRRRLENKDDWVRVEIESALLQGKHVIPVLVDGAEMPRASKLPESLEPFVRRNGARLTHERFKADVEGLIAAIIKLRSEDLARRQAEEERRQAEHAESMRRAAAEEQRRIEEQAARAKREADRAEAERKRKEAQEQLKLAEEELERIEREKEETSPPAEGAGQQEKQPEKVAAVLRVAESEAPQGQAEAATPRPLVGLSSTPPPSAKARTGTLAALAVVAAMIFAGSWYALGPQAPPETAPPPQPEAAPKEAAAQPGDADPHEKESPAVVVKSTAATPPEETPDRPVVSDAAESEARIKGAQAELARLGCYKGPVTGALDDETRKSLALYRSRKGLSPADDTGMRDSVLQQLKQESAGLCPPDPPPASSAKAPVEAPRSEPTPAKKNSRAAKREAKTLPERVERHRAQREAPVARLPERPAPAKVQVETREPRKEAPVARAPEKPQKVQAETRESRPNSRRRQHAALETERQPAASQRRQRHGSQQGARSADDDGPSLSPRLIITPMGIGVGIGF